MNNSIDLQIACNVAGWAFAAMRRPNAKNDFFYIFSTANNFFLAERKKFPEPSCKIFSNRLKRSFHFSQCGNAIFAFKVSLLRFIFSRIFKVHKNFRCWIYFSSNGFALCFRWRTNGNNLVQNWKCQWGINVSVGKKFSKISRKTEQVSRLRK